MKELAVIFGIYAGVGILTCIALAFRKGKSPHAIKAIQLFGRDPNPVFFALSILLWPLWVFMQIVEQDTLENPREIEKEESLDLLVDCIGKAATPIIPSGKVKIEETDYEAMSDEGKIERNEEVDVLAFSMGTLKERRFQPNA